MRSKQYPSLILLALAALILVGETVYWTSPAGQREWERMQANVVASKVCHAEAEVGMRPAVSCMDIRDSVIPRQVP